MRGIFDRLGKLVPGYQGYSDKNIARETDYQLRLFAQKKIEEYIYFIEKNKLSLSDEVFINVDNAQNDLRLICTKLKNQKHGYETLFARSKDHSKSLKIKLEAVIENDTKLIELINDIPDSDINAELINNLAINLDQIINTRKNISG